jgi:RNA polymerase sigma-70 factor (ECF subfamily)
VDATPDAERHWLRRAQAGDEQAFALILDRYRRPVFDFCWRLLRDTPAAEDVAQETFVRAYQHLADFTPGRAAFSSWLFLIARRQCLDLLRKRARQATDAHPAPDALTTRTARDEAAGHELAAAIEQAVSELPEDQRTALLLAEYEGQSTADIAAAMDASAKSIESRLYRARQFLRQRLAAWQATD